MRRRHVEGPPVVRQSNKEEYTMALIFPFVPERESAPFKPKAWPYTVDPERPPSVRRSGVQPMADVPGKAPSALPRMCVGGDCLRIGERWGEHDPSAEKRKGRVTIMMDDLDNAMLFRIDQACDAFEVAWKARQRPRIEEVLRDFPPEARPVLLRELLPIEWDARREAREALDLAEYLARFPDLAEWPPAALGHADTAHSERCAGPGPPLPSTGPETPPPSPATVPEDCPHAWPVPYHRQAGPGRLQDRLQRIRRGVEADRGHHGAPARPGRRGPRTGRCSSPRSNPAQLDHPHIVRVHDIGHTDDDLPFVVSSFIEGFDLKMRLEQGSLSPSRQLPW